MVTATHEPLGEPTLSLAEWLVLCVVCEEPRHGFAIARLLDSDGSLGRIWRVPKPVVYRAVQRLEQLGLVRSAELQPSRQGPAKSPVDATPAGRRLARVWLDRPAGHNRDVRSELLVKLALIDRSGADPSTLIDAQQDQLGPVARALRDRLTTATGFERTLVLWRSETVSATLRFLEAMREDRRPQHDQTQHDQTQHDQTRHDQTRHDQAQHDLAQTPTR